jgi:hypothetical protein
MQTSLSKRQIWAGRILSAIAILFMLFDATLHALKPAPVTEAFEHLGYPISTAVPLAITVVVIIAVYAFPRTAGLGAILLTGYLGGAVASHVRVGDTVFEIIFPGIIATLAWGGLVLRDPLLFERLLRKD